MDRKLIEYLPEFLQEFREIKIILEQEQKHAEDVNDAKESVFNNNFIETLTPEGCERWEKSLELTSRNLTLPERRNQILGRFAEQRPYTMRTLRNQLTAICGEDGYTCEMYEDEYILKVRIKMHMDGKYNAVKTLLDRIVPANVLIDLSLLYNTWGQLAGKTWGELSGYTWRQIKEDVKIVS